MPLVAVDLHHEGMAVVSVRETAATTETEVSAVVDLSESCAHLTQRHRCPVRSCL